MNERLSHTTNRECRVKPYTQHEGFSAMFPGMFGILLMSLMEGFGLEATDFSGIIEVILNGIETAIGFLILGILALLSLLGLIPNPFPWLV